MSFKRMTYGKPLCKRNHLSIKLNRSLGNSPGGNTKLKRCALKLSGFVSLIRSCEDLA